jgi:hypothetical protein
MNKVLCGTALCLGVLVLGTPSTALAMEPSLAKIPFSFIVGDQVLPAGEYRVSDATGMTDVIQIISTDNRAEAFALVESASAERSVTEGASVFSFKKIGNECYLSSVTIAGEETLEFVLPRHVNSEASTKLSAPEASHRQ